MLQAINLLGGMYTTPSKASSSTIHTPPPTPSRTRSPYFRKLDQDIDTPPERLAESSGSKRPKPDSIDDEYIPRRSKRLEARVVSPPTPESLPRKRPVKAEWIETPSKSPEVIAGRRRKKRQRLALSTGTKAKTVLGRDETGIVEPIGKIHLIQGRSTVPQTSQAAWWS